MLSVRFKYPGRIHGSASKNGWRMCRVCSGSCVCVHSWRCTDADLHWLSNHGPRRRHWFLNCSSPTLYEILYRRAPAGWLMLTRQMTSLSRCSRSGLSSCRHLTHFLLLFMPADTLVWLLYTVLGTTLQATTSESNISEALWNNTGKYLLFPTEESPTWLGHLILEENKMTGTLSHRWRRLVAFITSTTWRETVWGSQWCHNCRITGQYDILVETAH